MSLAVLAAPPNRFSQGCHTGFLCFKLPARGMPASANFIKDFKAAQCGNSDRYNDAPGGAFQD